MSIGTCADTLPPHVRAGSRASQELGRLCMGTALGEEKEEGVEAALSEK